MRALSRTDVEEAAARIAPYIHDTPVFTSKSLNALAGTELFFKCENFQKVGAFKARGAMNAALCLDDSVDAVVTHSSGNHGSALAWAAQHCDLACHVVAPNNASKFKRESMVRYGANVVDCGPEMDSREAVLEEFLLDHSATVVPPYDDPRIIAGQGTAALELLRCVPELEQIWVPVGGGGLAAGTILAANGAVQVVCAEPELANDAFLSMERGSVQPPCPPVTIADGLRSSLGSWTFRILHEANTSVVLVSENQILVAMRIVWEYLKIVIEPSSAVAVAALLRRQDLAKRKVGIILTGGNVEFPAAIKAATTGSEEVQRYRKHESRVSERT